jgi:hypothetical protein
LETVDILAFAEFCVVGDPNDQATTSLGDSFTVDEIKQRTKETCARNDSQSVSWFLGVQDTKNKAVESSPSGETTMRFVFNDGNQGWHYAWQSHRMTRMTQHQLRIIVLAGSNRPGKQLSYVCIAEEAATPFNMHCRRKRNRCAKTLAFASRYVIRACTSPTETATYRRTAKMAKFHPVQTHPFL